MLLRVTLSASMSLLLLLSSLTSVTEARERGHRSARLSSIWDIILPPKKSSSRARDDIQTNKINTEGNIKSAARGCIEFVSQSESNWSQFQRNSWILKLQQQPPLLLLQRRGLGRQWWPPRTGRGRSCSVWWTCTTAPPGGCSPSTGTARGSSCAGWARRVTGSRARCTGAPKVITIFSDIVTIFWPLTSAGYLFSSSGARCQPETTVACHRSQPLASLMSHAMSRGDLFLLP